MYANFKKTNRTLGGWEFQAGMQNVTEKSVLYIYGTTSLKWRRESRGLT